MKRPVSKKAGAAFIAQLMAPVPDFNRDDKELRKLEDRARKERIKRNEHAFYKQVMRTDAAHHLMRYWMCRRCAGDEVKTEREKADAAFYAAAFALMQMPAPTKKCLNWKLKYAQCGFRVAENAAFIAADRERLGAVQ